MAYSSPSSSTSSEDDQSLVTISDDEDFVVVDEDEEDDVVKCDGFNRAIDVDDFLSSQEEIKSQNVASVVRGDLVVRRQSLLPRVLKVSDGVAVARKPFKPPFAKDCSSTTEEQLRARLLARKKFVPWGSASPFVVKVPHVNPTELSTEAEKEQPKEKVSLPDSIEPLILWQSDELQQGPASSCMPLIMVDPLLVRFLRPHQREGVQFMFDCVSGLHSADGIYGCILADDMGLGKTLQSITLLFTLLRQGFDGKPMVKKAIIVTPTSLVSNWDAEIKKWVGDRIQLIALCESSRDEVVSAINRFVNPCSNIQVLIVSYETFRMHAPKFSQSGSCDLIICDEAHRLKNDQTMTNKALASLSCKRRILLSGTPMQNDLEEFYAMVNFTNPRILGDAGHFRRYYEMPILSGREPGAPEEQKTLGIVRSEELSAKVNQFILRRTNALLSNHLPPKIVEVVCCKLTPLQSELYNHFIQSKNVKRVLNEEAKNSKILAYITALKKLCNHPKLIYDTMKGGNSGISGFEDCMRFFPPEVFSGRSGVWTGGDGIWVELSGKMHVLARLLAQLRQKTDDRIVLVSNYTQTLDLFAQLCRERRYPFLRLDGTTSISKRQKLVNSFNDPSKDEFAFLLSSKAGGCGLNLIGGNRLVLFDPDWNPANDKQAAARVWRDGQKKRVYIYRFLSTGTIEEKVYQRQMSKEGLQKVIQQEQTDYDKGNFFSMEDLRDLFTYRADVRSEIHEKMNCIRCTSNDVIGDDKSESDTEVYRELLQDLDQSDQITVDIGGFAEMSGCMHRLKNSERQVGSPLEEDLLNWGHHSKPTTVPDLLLQASAGDDVTFVFTNQIGGKLIPVESKHPKTPSVNAVSSNQTSSLHGRTPMLNSTGIPFKPIQAKSNKLLRGSLKDVTNLSWRPKISFKKQPPLKRLCPSVQGNHVAG